MAFSIEAWLEELKRRLVPAFGPDLLFLGLQGSFGRGEAGPDSDIDLVVVLTHAGPEALRTYRSLLDEMPQRERACGFVCGLAQLRGWPPFDLLQLRLDTKPLLGSLDALLPPAEPAQMEEAVRVGASALYHAACHTFLHAPDNLPQLRALYKSAFFVLRLRHHARGGPYTPAAGDLLPLLSEPERTLLLHSLRRTDFQPEEAEPRCADLISWAGGLLAQT